MAKRRMLSVLAAMIAAVGLAAICSPGASAAGVASIEGKHDQAYSTVEGNLVIKNEMIPTDVILDRNKVGFYYACYNKKHTGDDNKHPEWAGYSISFSGTTSSAFDCYAKDKDKTTNMVFEGENHGNSYAIAWSHGDSMTEKTYTYNGANDYIKIVSSEAAIDVQTGAAYDVYMTISNIRVRTYACDKDDGLSTVVSIAYGYGNSMNSGYEARKGWSFFSGKSLVGKSRCRGGAIFDVKVELHDHSTHDKIDGKKMIWALNDIDIGDRMHSTEGANEYSSTYRYAEHFKFLRDGDGNIRGAVDEEVDGKRLKTYVSMVDILDGGTHSECKKAVRAGEQELVFNDDTIYHNFLVNVNGKNVWNHCTNSENGATDDNSTSALFLIDTTDFAFEWGGSKCGTTIDTAPYSKFTGKTDLSYDGSLTYNGAEISASNPITVNSATSKPIIFSHFIRRDMGIITGEDEPYKVIKSDWLGSDTAEGSVRFEAVTDHEYKPVYSTTEYANGSGGYRATLTPGQTKTYKHELQYRLSNVNNKAYASAGERTIVLKRPPATFTASVTPTVKNGSTNASIDSNKKVKITDSDGKYTVSFAYNIKRNNDTAGDTVGDPWNTEMKKDGSIPSPSHEASGTAYRTEGQSKGDDITGQAYTGNLRYGESITFCGNITYKSKIDASNGNITATASECVTVWRDNATCDDFPGFQYGLNYGANVGKIGVKNYDLTGDGDPTYTTPYSEMGVSIFARPADNIRFYYKMCAGALYPIREKNLSNTVTYSASGESTRLNNEGNGYLFRQSVSVVDGTFYNPRFWHSYDDGHNYNFLRGKNLVGDFWSPNGQSGKNYLCGVNTQDGYYQIAGKDDCARNSTYDVGAIDVGSVITQKLNWNEQTYNGSSFGNSPRTASASVVVPYNYVLRPYVTNNSGNTGKVAYLGESLKMTPGVVTVARTNTVFPSGKQNYATITKPTEINVKYYFKTASGSIINEASVPNSSRSGARLNNQGYLSGTTGQESQTSVDNGGNQLPVVNIQIPNSGVSVGDKVCVEVSVYPADSHDEKDAASVYGAGNNNIAISDGSSNGSNWVSSVSCSTIAKKPSMSVESSNAYSATSFKTANYTRTIGSKKFNFGSWSEYGVFGRVWASNSSNASLFVSGAALGYSRNGYSGANGVANVTRANDDASADGNKVSTKTNSNECTFMTQTFANANCNTSSTSIGGVMASQYEQRIKERYASSGGTFEITGLPTKVFGGTATYYDVSGYSGSDVIVSPSGIIRFDSKKNLYISSLPNISNEQFAEKGIESPNHTIVYSAPENSIVIDGNLNYDGGLKVGSDDLTQVIIIAKNVYFTSQPTYINAVIIADNVNTCRFDSGTRVAVGGKSGASIISSNVCNQALRFDAPVVVKKLALNRTAGAGNGDDAIRRAEIFNLNMANFLWSFNQMSRLSQAATTYSRELPTRY